MIALDGFPSSIIGLLGGSHLMRALEAAQTHREPYRKPHLN